MPQLKYALSLSFQLCCKLFSQQSITGKYTPVARMNLRLADNLMTLRILWFLLFFSLVGCGSSSNTAYYVNPGYRTDTLESLRAMSGNTRPQKSTMTGVRRLAIEETALTVGAQAGLASRSKQINLQLEKQADHLNKAFDFNRLLLQHNVVPPVLLEGRNTLNLADPDTIRIADRVYKISKQARFVTTPPNWREYVSLNYIQPDPPVLTLLPKNPEEQKIWDYYVTEGWRRGVEQANVIFADNLAQLKQDYNGMILYRKLLAQNMVSPPHVAKTHLGVTGDDREIHIDDQVLRITAHPGLKPDSRVWKPAVAKPSGEPQVFIQDDGDKLISNLPKEGWEPVIKKD